MRDTKRMLRWIFFLSAFLLAMFAIMKPKAGPKPIYVPVADMPLIAHAGGGLPQGIYSNSREALDRSAENGFTLIEIDFSWAANGELILIRDWSEQYYQYFSRLSFMPPVLANQWPRQVESAAKFSSLTMNHGLTQMTLDDLIDWLDKNPGIKIVTDVKSNNVKALAQIKAKVGPRQNRFVVQIYSPDEYDQIINLGYQDVIFTAYRSALSDGKLSEFSGQHRLFALTVPAARASRSLATSLAATGTPLYVHTLNTSAQAEALKRIGVTGLYTDYLFPAH